MNQKAYAASFENERAARIPKKILGIKTKWKFLLYTRLNHFNILNVLRFSITTGISKENLALYSIYLILKLFTAAPLRISSPACVMMVSPANNSPNTSVLFS